MKGTLLRKHVSCLRVLDYSLSRFIDNSCEIPTIFSQEISIVEWNIVVVFFDYIWSRDLTTIKLTVVIMALFDQQQQQEEQPNQVQPYGVCVGPRRIRNVQQVPYVPDMNMGRPLFRARQLPAYPVREQQQHVMLQDRINQDVQHNMIQDNIAYNRRLYPKRTMKRGSPQHQ